MARTGTNMPSASRKGGKGGDSQQRRHRRAQNPATSSAAASASASSARHTSVPAKGAILILHGNRQTGQLFLGRIERIVKRFRKEFGLRCVVPEAPHMHEGDGPRMKDPNEGKLQTWWHLDLKSNQYVGLEDSLDAIRQSITQHETNSTSGGKQSNENAQSRPPTSVPIVGILGFSQGARMAHLLALLHSRSQAVVPLSSGPGAAAQEPSDSYCWLPDLRFCIFVSGYDAPLPSNFPVQGSVEKQSDMISDKLSSLHVYGTQDPLVTPDQSKALLKLYPSNGSASSSELAESSEGTDRKKTAALRRSLEHDGKHFVPSKASHLETYSKFIATVCKHESTDGAVTNVPEKKTSQNDASTKAPSRAQSAQPSAIGGTRNSLASSAVPQNKTNPAGSATSSVSVRDEDSTKTAPQPPPPRIPLSKKTTAKISATVTATSKPDEESQQMQQDEVQALEAIYPDEFEMISTRKEVDFDFDFDFPIAFTIQLTPVDDGGAGAAATGDDDDGDNNWPPHKVSLRVDFPHNYPNESLPRLSLKHDNNIYEFPYLVQEQVVLAAERAAQEELGMPCVMSCIEGAKEFLDGPKWEAASQLRLAVNTNGEELGQGDEPMGDEHAADGETEKDALSAQQAPTSSLLARSQPKEIANATIEGLDIAKSILQRHANSSKHDAKTSTESVSVDASGAVGNTGSGGGGGGGSFWTYTIGLVGKPSAGKSTFFNAATAFARQTGHDDSKSAAKRKETASVLNMDADMMADMMAEEASKRLGGASMAPHPFTTINPNVGFCLVPAPLGSCPEDDLPNHVESRTYGSTHGRTATGRRFLPVLLKDVAGLVPGAYKGKGRGNQFLNDLCDSHVLIHVVDASGTADAQGNRTVTTEVSDLMTSSASGNNDQRDADEGDEASADYTNPLTDLAWIRTELLQWVTMNLMAKWDTVQRKGRIKLVGMLSGYGQPQATTHDVCDALEHFMEATYQRSNVLDSIPDWNEADVHRFVSAFLGVRFPMALALNKCDLPSSKKYIEDVTSKLPIHGAHVGTPMVAKQEMGFIRKHLLKRLETLEQARGGTDDQSHKQYIERGNSSVIDLDVWQCLTSAISLKEPMLVFPVSNFTTFAPMVGLNQVATNSPSLPSPGMIACIQASGGCLPSLWDPSKERYGLDKDRAEGKDKQPRRATKDVSPLRDVLLMKPGSTVEDVFLTLKNSGALSGDFVRAEACGGVSREKPKPVPKHTILGRHNRIIKIQTTKRSQWQ